MEIISTVALISINETLLVQLLSFLVFLIIINRVMFKPLRRAMDDRNGYMASLEQEITEAGARTDTILADIRKKEKATSREAQRLLGEMETAANNDIELIHRAGQQTVQQLREAARTDLEQTVASIRSQLKEEAESIALILMNTILERKVIK